MIKKFIVDFAFWLYAWVRANVEFDPQVTNLSSTTDSCPGQMASQPTCTKTITYLPFLDAKKLEELGTYSILEFEAKYRKAASGDAKTFAAFLKKYQELKVFDFGERDKKQVFECLKEFFPDEIKYGYPNFAYYF